MADLLVETFTGSDGSAPSGSNWKDVVQATIQSNQLRLLTAGSAFDSAQVAVADAILAGQGGDFDMLIADVAVNDATNDGYLSFNFASPSGGTDYQITLNVGSDSVSIEKRVSYSGMGVEDSGTIAGGGLADGGTLDVRIVKNGGLIQAYFWSSGSQPSTPTIEWTDGSPLTGDSMTISITNGNETSALQVTIDNVTISTVESGPTYVGYWGVLL